jgi:phosphate transport system permease protein
MRGRPYWISLVLALIPVAMFVGIVVMLVWNSLPVVADPGIGALFGDSYSSKYSGTNLNQFGLMPALAGTLLVTLIAILIALPVSLAMAIVATEFPMGPLGRVVRPLVDFLSGIPPIVYAVSVLAFVTLFMIPKFAANSTFDAFDPAKVGADPSTWPPGDVPFSPGGFPWDLTGSSNSTLLGGVLIALMVIPFLTPLLVDAMRNVPSAAREASFALGANRGHTLRRVILPVAMPSIVAAVSLGALKAFGDTIIVAFAIGWEAQKIPNPVFDVLERTSTLAAQSAGLIASFETLDATCKPAECATGYAAATMLLLAAGVIVLAISVVQARWRREMAT